MMSIYIYLWLSISIICCYGNVQKLNKPRTTTIKSVDSTVIQTTPTPVTELVNLENKNTTFDPQNSSKVEEVTNGNNVSDRDVTHHLNNSLSENDVLNETTINRSDSISVNITDSKNSSSQNEIIKTDSTKEVQPEDYNTHKFQIMKSLHSNIDDLLRVDRQRRALRYKRDSNYEDLMALMNYLEANGADMSDRKSFTSDNSEYFGKFGDESTSSFADDEEGYEPMDAVSEQGNYGSPNLQDLVYYYSPKVSEVGNTYQWEPYYSRKSDAYQYPQSKMRRTNYYARMPFSVFAGQRRKRKGVFRENSAFGRWGNFEKRRPQSYDNDVNEVSKIYSLASLLGDRYYPQSLRRKRSPTSSTHQSQYLIPM